MNTGNSIFVIGSINDDIVAGAERHPAPGETVRGTSLEHFPGGKGANQAVAAARAGTTTVMVGATGDDDAGRGLTAYLASAGVDVSGVSALPEAPTGTALIAVSGGENTIIVVAGANGHLSPDALAGVEFQSGDIVVAQYETPVNTTIEGFRRARAAGAITVLNPAPADHTPQELLDVTDYLVVNEHEFEIIFGEDVSRIVEDAEVKGEVVDSTFSGTLIVTLGSDGLIAWPEAGVLRVDGLRVDAVDSTGAGDCFVGYLAAGLSGGEALDDALDLANRAAALSVTRPGAASSIPTRDELK